MGKPPFQFKPNKTKVVPNRGRLPLVGTEDVAATYADIFVMLNEQDTGLASIYFYQRRLADMDIATGETETLTIGSGSAKCVGRLLLSQRGVEKLLEALAENRGFTVVRKTQTEEEKKK